MWCRSGTYEYDIHHLYWTVLLSQTFSLIFFLFFISKAVDMKPFWHLTCRSHEVVRRIAGLEPEASWVSWVLCILCILCILQICSSFRLLCFKHKRLSVLAQVVLRGKGDQVVAEAPLHYPWLWKTRAKKSKRKSVGIQRSKRQHAVTV